MKICNICKVEKPLQEFHKHSKFKDGFNTKCKVCKNEDSKKHYRENIIQAKAKHKSWYKENKEFVSDYKQSLMGRFTTYKSSAKQRGFKFDLTFEEFKSFWKKSCHYCGDYIRGIGLDRVDSLIGYSLKNVVPCCEICNRMKMSMSRHEFIKQARKIINYTGKRL